MLAQLHNIQSNFDYVKKGEAKDRDSGAKGKEISTATLFYNPLKEKTDIGKIAGNIFVTFLDILFLTNG